MHRITLSHGAVLLKLGAVSVFLMSLAFMPERLCAAEATSQPTTAPAVSAEQISNWLSDLSSFDFAKRDSARIGLMQLGADQLDVLRRQIQRLPRLTASQRSALHGIVQEIYLSGDDYERDPSRGFLGILMDLTAFESRDAQQPNENGQMPGVIVAERIPGFCASRSLRDGDIILGMPEEDAAFRTPTELQTAIRSLKPGTTVRLQVLRLGQIVDLHVTLDFRPTEATIDPLSLERLRSRRATKFAKFWQETFAPLLNSTSING